MDGGLHHDLGPDQIEDVPSADADGTFPVCPV